MQAEENDGRASHVCHEGNARPKRAQAQGRVPSHDTRPLTPIGVQGNRVRASSIRKVVTTRQVRVLPFETDMAK